jgi:hypothetical protein
MGFDSGKTKWDQGRKSGSGEEIKSSSARRECQKRRESTTATVYGDIEERDIQMAKRSENDGSGEVPA